MLSVNPKLQRNVEAMKHLASLPPNARRKHIRSLTPVVTSKEDLEAERLSKTISGLDQNAMIAVHPTVMLSSMDIDDRTRSSLMSLHDTTQEASRLSILDQRRHAAGKELHGLLRHVFAHYRTDGVDENTPTTIVGRRRKAQHQQQQGGPKATVMVPTMSELMNALGDERMHFEVITHSKDSTQMLESIARELQWLIAELGASKERGDLYEQQYKLVLLDYGRQMERLGAMQDQCADLGRQLSELGSALQAERAHSSDAANEASRQISMLRENLKDAMEATLALQASGGGPALPPLRGSRTKSSTTGHGAMLAALLPGSSLTPRSTAASKHGTPRSLQGHGGGNSRMMSPRSDSTTSYVTPQQPQSPPLPPPTAAAAHPMLSIDEKERYLTTIAALRKELDEQKRTVAEAKEELTTAHEHVDAERERVAIAERVGSMELQATQQLLKSVRDGHSKQLSTLQSTLAASQEKNATQDRTIEALQTRLKESSARLLSLQNLLLSGPSVQTLLLASTTNKVDAQDATESLGDLADRIAEFADQFTTVGAQDFAAVKEITTTLLEHGAGSEAHAAAIAATKVSSPPGQGDGDASSIGRRAESHNIEVTGDGGGGGGEKGVFPTTSPTTTSPPVAEKKLRRKPGQSVERAAQTDDWAMPMETSVLTYEDHTHIPTAERNSPISATHKTSSAPKGKPSVTSSGGGLRAGQRGSGTNLRKGSATDTTLNEITDRIGGVALAGHDGGSLFANPVELGPESPNDRRSPAILPPSLTPIDNLTPLEPPGAQTNNNNGTAAKPLAKTNSKTKLSGSLNNSGKGASPVKPAGKAAGKKPTKVTDDDDDVQSAADAALEEEHKKLREVEREAMRKVASTFKSGGISSTNFDASSDATNEISANLERMTALRKQISQSADQIHQLQQQLDKEKRHGIELDRRLDDQAKLHAKDADKIMSMAKQVETERNKGERLSERVSTLLSDISTAQERLHDLHAEKDAMQDSLMIRIEGLERVIEKYKKADERTAMIDKERQFLEVCERAIRCLMSAEATSSCSICLSRLSNPISIVPCGHTCCEQCFLLHQAENNVSLPSDAYEAVQVIFRYREAIVSFHEEAERAQSDFLAGLIPLPPEAKRPPKAPTGYLTRATFTKCLTGCSFLCPECDKATGMGYCQQLRLDELCTKVAYVGSVVGELQALGKSRYADEVRISDPTTEVQLEALVIADKSKLTQRKTYVDLEESPGADSDNDT